MFSFTTGLRQEAIQLALAQKQARGEGGVPAPTKRQSFLTKRLAENVDNQRPSSSYISPTHFTGEFFILFTFYSWFGKSGLGHMISAVIIFP